MVDIIALERLRILTHYRYTIIINQSDAFNSFSTTLKTYRRFPITLRVNVSNVNISANIYPPPFKKNPPLKSSQNSLSNGGSSAVKSLCYIREVKIPRFRCTGTSSIFWLQYFRRCLYLYSQLRCTLFALYHCLLQENRKRMIELQTSIKQDDTTRTRTPNLRSGSILQIIA